MNLKSKIHQELVNLNIYPKLYYILSSVILYLQITYEILKNSIYKYTKYKNIKIIDGKLQIYNVYYKFLVLLSIYKIKKIGCVLFNKRIDNFFVFKYIENIFNDEYCAIHLDVLYQNKNVSVIFDNENSIEHKLYETIEYIEKNKKLLEKNKFSLNSIMTCANIIDKSHNVLHNLKCIFDKYSTNKTFNNTIKNVLLFNDIKYGEENLLEVKIFDNSVNDNMFKSYKVELNKIKDLNIIDLYSYDLKKS